MYRLDLVDQMERSYPTGPSPFGRSCFLGYRVLLSAFQDIDTYTNRTALPRAISPSL